MPIRAHAAGGRVSPHLGPRPPAWLPDSAGMRPPRSCDGGCHDGGIAGDPPALDPAAGATPVMLLRSTPRQAYRIYSEEEFLAADDWQVEAEPGYGSEPEPAREVEPEFALLGQHRPRSPRPWGTLAALAALTSAMVAVVGVVALNATRSQPHGDRRFAARIAARESSPPEIVADRPRVRRLDMTSPRTHVRQVVRRVSERRPLAPERRPPLPERRPLRVGPQPISEEHPYLPPESSPAPTPAPASTPASTGATATTATTTTPATGGASAEFGFERR